MIMFGSLFNDWEGLRMECLQQAGHARKACVTHGYRYICINSLMVLRMLF